MMLQASYIAVSVAELNPEVTEHDAESARALVEQTDYDGQELLWHITRGFYDNYETAAEIMVAQWAEIGINVKMMVVDNFSLAYQRPFHLLNMSNGTSFIGIPSSISARVRR